MATHTSAAPTPTSSESPPRSWSMTRVVLAAAVVGTAAAVTLTLAVLPGATESVVTGSLLLGFAAGWGTLVVASARRTSEPQPWARVPATAMAAAGAALVVLSPGDAVLTALGWVWPPLMLALVVWTSFQVRRSLPSRARWLVVPSLVVLAAASVGTVVQDVTGPRVLVDHPAPGTTYAVGDHRLHIACRGTGGPTVVLFNGMGEFSGSWTRIVDQISPDVRVCAYDRAGQGWSDDSPRSHTGLDAAADLHALLAAAGEAGPYVLVGHSIGGPYALTYAAEHLEDVAGVVLLDSSSPRQFTAMPAYPRQYALMKRGLALLPTLARIGLGPAMRAPSLLPGADGEVAEAMSGTVRAKRNGRDELVDLPALFEQADALTTLGDRPLAVVTASENLTTAGWPEEQDRLAGLSSSSSHRIAESSHEGLLDDLDGAAASVAAIRWVLVAVAAPATP